MMHVGAIQARSKFCKGLQTTPEDGLKVADRKLQEALKFDRSLYQERVRYGYASWN
jgi:hypothetical protein